MRSVAFAAGLATLLLPAFATAAPSPTGSSVSALPVATVVGNGNGPVTLMGQFMRSGNPESVSATSTTGPSAEVAVTCYGTADIGEVQSYTGGYPTIEYWGEEDCSYPVSSISSSEILQRSYSEDGPWSPSASYTYSCSNTEHCYDPPAFDQNT